MREIKFRARRADTGAWVYGDLTNTQKINTKEQADETGRRSQPVIRVANYDVDETTIGQFTGLKDCNAKEIYEGDILALDPIRKRHLFPVVWDKGAFCLRTAVGDNQTMKGKNLGKFIIVGNIYDNAELINNKRQWQ